MSVVRYTCILDGQPFPYNSLEDGLPIAWSGANNVSEHKIEQPIISEPVIDTNIHPNWMIKYIAFRMRFPMTVQAKIVTLAQTDPDTSAFMQALAAMISAQLGFDLSSRTSVEYRGLMYLVSKKALTMEQADTILNTPLAPNEVWNG